MAKRMYIGVATATNMISNGTFDSMTGWTVQAGTWSIVSSSVYGVPASSGLYQRIRTTNTISLISGHKYYCSVEYIKTGTPPVGWGMHNETSNTTYWIYNINNAASTFTKVSNLYTATANATTNFLLYCCRNTYTSDLTVKYNNLFVIDLTALYGAGKEPTQAQCDKYFYVNSKGMVVCNDASIAAKARKVKKMYIGVGGKARKVKKGYIGVGGKARQFFSASGTPAYHGTAAALSQASEEIGYSYNDNYALFIGGYNNNMPDNHSQAKVEAYNKSLVHSIPTSAPYSCIQYSVGAKAGSYAVVFGGSNSTNGKKAFAYSSTLVQTTGIATANYHSYGGAGTLGNYAIGGGGSASNTSSSAGTSSVEAINGSLTVTTASAMSNVRRYPKTGLNEKYIIFACGDYHDGEDHFAYNTVDAYNPSLVKTVATNATFTDMYYNSGVGSAGDYALIFQNTWSDKTAVPYNAYNLNLVRTSGSIATGVGRSYFGIGNVNGCTFIGGGLAKLGSNGYSVNEVWGINDSLVATLMGTGLQFKSYNMGVGSIGNYVLFASGRQNWSSTNEGYRSYVTVYKAD